VTMSSANIGLVPGARLLVCLDIAVSLHLERKKLGSSRSK